MEENVKTSEQPGQSVLSMAENPNPGLGLVGISLGPVTILPSGEQSFVEAFVQTPAGAVPRVSSRLNFKDRFGSFKCRLGAGRMNYVIDPGLYALGVPDGQSPVVVSANYKMSFDVLRAALPGRDVWILVLDTKGINVWCAAGKGTFGTSELLHRIDVSGLKKVVHHRTIILPQLGAPGVAAHRVKQFSGFKVHYGPIRAQDLPDYLDRGLKATPEMRVITFPLKDRAVLIPIELVETIKPFFMIAAALLLMAGIMGPAGFKINLVHEGLFAVAAIASAIIGGAVLHPLLLPYIPGRAFSLKGLLIGLVIAVGLIFVRGFDYPSWPGKMHALSWLLMVPAISAYLAMNFTGCSTYTSLSGVKKEMRFALPAQITAASVGLVLWITSLILNRG